MKKIIISILTVLSVSFTVKAAPITEIEMSTKGQTIVGVGAGLPSLTQGAEADMPSVSVFFSAGLASGFIQSNLFGRNGAVDFGVNYGICHYSDRFGLYNTIQQVKVFQNTLTLRSAFHFQFIKNLDTYFGVAAGVNICSETFRERTEYSDVSTFEQWNEVEPNVFRPVLGIYGGARWFFSNRFGLGVELSSDFLRTNDEACEEAYGRSHFGGSALPIVSICASIRLGK